MTLAYAGSRLVGEAIESNLDCARYLAQLVDTSDDLRTAGPGGAVHLLLPLPATGRCS
jgi:aromatic-L-amino-acid/L-tryptophan decarboxylase